MRVLSLTLVALAVTILAAPPAARACSCAEITPEAAFDQSDAAFEGVATSVAVDEGNPDVGVDEEVRVTFRVTQRWKGADAEEVEVRTAGSEAACGYPFQEGQAYMVYAIAHEGTLRTGLCSRTRLAADAGDDRAFLGSGVTPVDPTVEDSPAPAARPEESGCKSCAAAGRRPGADLLVLCVVAWLCLRRRR